MFEKRNAVGAGQRDEPELQQLTGHKSTLVRLEVKICRNQVSTEFLVIGICREQGLWEEIVVFRVGKVSRRSLVNMRCGDDELAVMAVNQ